MGEKQQQMAGDRGCTGLLRGRAFQGGDWQEFQFGAWAFYCKGQELGLAIRTVNVL